MTTFRLALVLLAACGGAKYPVPTTPTAPALPKGGIEAAALPYQVLEARTGRGVDEPAFWSRLAKARAVCLGEEHPNPHHHWMQLHSVREISKRIGKDKLALGLEMIQRPFQGPVDDYVAKKIDAATLQSRAGWAERWGYDWGFYSPTFDATIAVGGSILALNAPKELVKKIVRQGLESLTPDEKLQLPELKLDDASHRAWFDALMGDMGGAGVHSKKDGAPADPNAPANPHGTKPADPDAKPANPHSPHGGGSPHGMPSADRIYTAQVLWDETMADGAAKWLKANPNGHLVILAGNGHCHDSAIVNRLKRRGVADVLSVRAVLDDGEGGLADVLAKPMNDYVFVLQLPKSTAPAPKTAKR
ncbi:MAG: ChaN family lipoprotein [Deltaproteobacteria bacterium]|nr:ChaN family lipoprotein [Deltaproteobacteria bacterium]